MPRLTFVLFFIILVSSSTHAQEKQLSTEEQMMLKKKMLMEQASSGDTKRDEKKYCVKDVNIGVGGHDVVSYFSSGAPKKGNARFTYTHDAVSYRFVSAKNLSTFKKNPEKYLPQFGGWCAMSLALGKQLCPDYDNFIIQEGKLYIFETTAFTNGQVLWNRDPSTNRTKAQGRYDDILKRLAAH